MNDIQVEEALKDIRGAYAKGDNAHKQLLESVFGAALFNQKITDRVKTLQDVCRECGVSYDEKFGPEAVKGMSDYEIGHREWLYLAQALNEGVDAKYGPNERNWFPYYFKDDKNMVSGRGLSFYYSVFAYSSANVAPRLTFRSEPLLKHAMEFFPGTFEKVFNK